jgi:bifunctional DNase/RNase
VTELRDGSFLATLALSGPAGERRLDTRPSDAIALAVRMHAPLFVSDAVLDVAGTFPIVELDDDEIDAEVDDFRGFLAELDPADFLSDDEPVTGPEHEDTSGTEQTDGETAED